MSANLIETTVNILSTDWAYIFKLAETAAKNLRDKLRNELVVLDMDDEDLDGIAEIVREERRRLGN